MFGKWSGSGTLKKHRLPQNSKNADVDNYINLLSDNYSLLRKTSSSELTSELTVRTAFIEVDI